MPTINDALAVHFRNQFRMTLVSMPHKGFGVMDVLRRDGNVLQRIGSLDQFFIPNAGRGYRWPNRVNHQLGDMNANIYQTSSYNVDFGAATAFFQRILGFMGIGGANLGGLQRHIERVKFQMINPVLEDLNLIELDNCLYQNPVVQNVGNYQQELEDGNLYTILKVIRTSSFEIIALDENNNEVEIGANPFGMQANVGINNQNQNGARIRFNGNQPVTIAILPAKINHINGHYCLDPRFNRNLQMGANLHIDAFDGDQYLSEIHYEKSPGSQ